jgi:hypothetical protein
LAFGSVTGFLNKVAVLVNQDKFNLSSLNFFCCFYFELLCFSSFLFSDETGKYICKKIEGVFHESIKIQSWDLADPMTPARKTP